MDEALQLGTRDAKLFFHAGMIHRALGDTERAREYLTSRALSTNPHFHVLQAAAAARALDELAPRLGGRRRPGGDEARGACPPACPRRALACAVPGAGRRAGHPMGNFSISHYAAIRVLADGVELRYLLDLAEIPPFRRSRTAVWWPKPAIRAFCPIRRARPRHSERRSSSS